MAHLRDLLFSHAPDGAAARRSSLADQAAHAEQRFLRYTRHRRSRLDRQLGEHAAGALRLLPYLLHVNLPGLPGYVDDPACPFGVANYAPSNGDLVLARRLFTDARPRRIGILRPALDLVAAMGSAGTIGFSGDSDLDVWLCHSDALSGASLALYRRKVQAVEERVAHGAGLEVHLFLQPTASIRDNDFGATDVEGCGSAMGALLKEEFYRTGVLLAGRAPLWWLVPPGAGPDQYREALAVLAADATFATDEFVDLGWVERVPLGELFGAAIWQIAKGGTSPFKSALKMGLLEKAVCSGDTVTPLCEVLKEGILAGELPDPYRLLFDAVLAHYRSAGEEATEDLLARCFYLKTGTRLDPERLQEAETGEGDRRVLGTYARAWGWGPRRLQHLNEFQNWRFEWVQALAGEMDRFFMRAYKRIRAALDRSGEAQRITDRDLTVLGRKIQAAYRRSPGKVERLHLVTRGVEEASLSLYQEALPDGELPWRLYRGRVTPYSVDEHETALLRSADDPLELLVWAAQNRLLGARTQLASHGVEREISSADLEAVAANLRAFVTATAAADHPLADLLESPYPTRLLVVPNLGLEGEELRELGAVYATSWGETYYRRWTGPACLQGLLEDALVPFLLTARDRSALQVFAPSRKVGNFLGSPRRLQRELPAIAGFLGGHEFPEGLRRRYVGPGPQGHLVLDRGGADDLRQRTFHDRESLLRHLSAVGPYRAVETRVEALAGDLAILKAVFEAQAPGVVDVFVLQEAATETLLVVDETGNFTHFPGTRHPEPYALARLLLFLDDLLPELAGQPGSPLAGRPPANLVRIHSLLGDGTCRVRTATHEYLSRVGALGLEAVGLTIERSVPGPDGAGGYRITWGDQTICSGEVDNPLAEVRRRILASRRGGAAYDLFVTHLFLDDRFRAQYCGPFVATGHYLFYKKAIEQRLSG